ncbi:MAG: response regulator transcription factor [Muribaculaceae bacterium]|nr:response regulator transcription factor [Muribaculaceae bacterium]
MDTKKAKILLVDDEEALREGLGVYLELEGYEVDTAASAEEALTFDLPGYDLLLLDIMMGGMSGVELAARLKENPATASLPIIFLTARDSDEDVLKGLTLGADDYIAKPYSIKIVIARIEAVLRRFRLNSPGVLQRGVVCDRQSLVCRVDGVEVRLARKEFEILALMLENPSRVFSREELLEKIWPEKVVVVDRAVDVHITRLRGKIAPYGRHIVTRSGYGYGWQD